MIRREFTKLAAVLLTAGSVTGCLSDGQDIEGDVDESDQPIEILDHGTTTDESAPLIVEGRARNTSDSEVPYAEITVRFYDGQGQLLDTSSNDIRNLAPGGTWRFNVPYTGSNVGEVAGYDIGVSTDR